MKTAKKTPQFRPALPAFYRRLVGRAAAARDISQCSLVQRVLDWSLERGCPLLADSAPTAASTTNARPQ